MLTVRIALAAVVILAGIVVAQSQEPSPSRGEPTKKEQTQTQKPNQPATNNPQSAPQPPFIVNVLPTPKTEEQAEDERRERKEKAELDRRLVDLTGELAEFTAGLFYATVAVAIATIFLVIATGALGYFGYRQSQDMKDSIRVASANAAASELSAQAAVWVELPTVFVENIRCKEQKGFKIRNELPNMPVKIEIDFRNVGRSPAIVSIVAIDFGVFRELPAEPRYDWRKYTVAIDPKDRCRFVAPNILDLSKKDAAAVRGRSRYLWLWGAIQFDDFMESQHQVGFCACWYWSAESKGFIERYVEKYVYTHYKPRERPPILTEPSRKQVDKKVSLT
jgi:hypothetical protein